MKYRTFAGRTPARRWALGALAALVTLQAPGLRAQRIPDAPAVADSSTAGFRFAFGLGYAAWGADSRLGGAIPSIDIAAGYELEGGLGLEYRLTATALEFSVLDNSLAAYYLPSHRDRRLPVGPAVSIGLPIRLGGGASFRDVDDYAAFSYGYGLRGYVPLGTRRRTRMFAEAGVLTVRERFTERRGWAEDGGMRWSMKHSGARVRVGLSF